MNTHLVFVGGAARVEQTTNGPSHCNEGTTMEAEAKNNIHQAFARTRDTCSFNGIRQ